MEGGLTCLVCGGTNFHKESGFFFCNECQTQSQDIEEHLFDEFDVKQERKASRTISNKPVQLKQAKLTTWECYNYVLKGLCYELVELGAEGSLVEIVKKLWIKYLVQIEVVSLEKPKLQAVNTKIDAEIVYGKRKRKRKKRSSSKSSYTSADLSLLDPRAAQRERTRKRRELVKAQYEHSFTASADTSLHELLPSVDANSDNSSQSSIPLKYNKYAERELRKKQSKEHLDEHLEDFESEMVCHHNSYKETSKAYQNSPYLLSINKIYSLLYLGLLLSKSKIQLSDMLRFIREGHLSFNNFRHFFPEELSNNFLTQVFPRKYSFSSFNIRRSTYQLGRYLDVLKYIKVQNLELLIEKFSEELNLPNEIKDRALSTLLISLPKMSLKGKLTLIPNYEARAVSLILFQLKLLYGIDGKTERYLSRYVESLNDQLEMFNFMKWIQFIDYRNYVLKKLHFPTQFSSTRHVRDGHDFTKFVLFKNPDYDKLDPTKKYNKTADDCRQLLLRLMDKQESVQDPVIFQPSFTPSRDYIKNLLRHRCLSEVEAQILSYSFMNCSTNFTNPSNSEEAVTIIPSSANQNIKFSKLKNSKTNSSNELKEARLFKLVEVESTIIDVDAPVSVKNNGIEVEKLEIVEDPELKENLTSDSIDLSNETVLYQAQKFYWINSDCNLGYLSKSDFEQHLSTYPTNFQLITKEMARILEQNVQDFLCEFTLTEIYLLYEEKFQNEKNLNINNIYSDKRMKSQLRKAKLHW